MIIEDYDGEDDDDDEDIHSPLSHSQTAPPRQLGILVLDFSFIFISDPPATSAGYCANISSGFPPPRSSFIKIVMIVMIVMMNHDENVLQMFHNQKYHNDAIYTVGRKNRTG